VVAGVSEHPGKFGFAVLHHILLCGYEGEVYALGRQPGRVLGVPVATNVEELPYGAVDMVYVCSPAATVPDLLRACAKKGIKAAFIASAGFSEAGEGGQRAEENLAELAEELGLLVVGPNGMGVISTPVRLCAQLQAPYPPPGRIGVVSQSGNFVMACLNYALASGVGISRAVSAGNARAVGIDEYLAHLAVDDATDVALTYVEGITDGRRFFERLRAATARKPVVVVKGGVTADGARAASSHTGALAHDASIFEGMCRQAGATRAATVEEGFEAAATFATQPLPAGPRTVVLTLAGGWGVLAADAIAATRLQLLPLPASLRSEIDARVPPRWSRQNPVDLAGGETRDTVTELLELITAHPDVDAVIFVGFGIQSNTAKMIRTSPFFPDHGLDRIVAYHERQDVRYGQAAAAVSERYAKPVLSVTELALTDPTNGAPATVRETGRMCYPSINRAVTALDHLWRYARYRQRVDDPLATTAR
jgi:acetyltransferase